MSNKTLLVTGASSGIGRELTRYYLAQGHKVLALARHTEALDDLLQAFPSRCIPVRVDLTDKKSCSLASEWIKGEVGSLDIAILNAGTCEYVDVKQLSLEPFEKVMAINWHGTVNSLLMVMPLLRNTMSQGKIAQLVAVSSMASLLPMPRSQVYGASKVAVEYLFNALRVDMAKEPIIISIVRPGFVKTPLTERNDFPMPWALTAEQAAQKIATAIARKQWLIQFPWPLVVSMRLVACLPLWLQTRLLQRLSRS